jgi:uncharacterized phiE125 gp8 family phage protein
MKFKTITAVTDEPVSLTEARLQCKVDSDDESHDGTLTALITAAREFAEHYTGRALAPVTLEAALDEFPACDYFDLPMPPVTSVTSIKYTDTAGAEITMDSGDYALSTYGDSRTVSLTYGAIWPSTQDVPDAVRVRFVTGYAAEDIPRAVKAAMLLHIEIESPLNPLSPDERKSLERARDSLLDTKKIWGA